MTYASIALGVNTNGGPEITGGGTVTSDSTYYYRTFTASTTITIQNGPIAYESICIAGGGGGNFMGGGAGGAGGAGGFVYATDSFDNFSYFLTITFSFMN
jgi:hypothetical protein